MFGIGNPLGRPGRLISEPKDLVPDNELRRLIWDVKYPRIRDSEFHWKWKFPKSRLKP